MKSQSTDIRSAIAELENINQRMYKRGNGQQQFDNTAKISMQPNVLTDESKLSFIENKELLLEGPLKIQDA